jgi:hypothetical protein
MSDERAPSVDHDEVPAVPGPGRPSDDVTVLGVLEDERLRAVVSTTGDHTLVTLEGHLDQGVAPVVDELLEAVARWHHHLARSTARDALHAEREGGHPPETSSGPGPTLWLDTRGLEDGHPLGWSVLAGHRARWIRERGACVTWRPSVDQRSSR